MMSHISQMMVQRLNKQLKGETENFTERFWRGWNSYNILNQGKNGYYLYEHIAFCDPVNYGVEEPLQYISGDKEKMVVYHCNIEKNF